MRNREAEASAKPTRQEGEAPQGPSAPSLIPVPAGFQVRVVEGLHHVLADGPIRSNRTQPTEYSARAPDLPAALPEGVFPATIELVPPCGPGRLGLRIGSEVSS